MDSTIDWKEKQLIKRVKSQSELTELKARDTSCPRGKKVELKIIRTIVKERIEGGANEKAVLRLFINCPFVCINFDFFWLNKARQLYMDF